MTTPAKVLAIGMDSAHKDLLLQWSESGDLPTLQFLRRRGVCGVMTSPPGLGDDATWASLYTGVSPARHGRYFYSQVWPGTYKATKFRDLDLKHEPFWDTISCANKRVVIIDVPKSPLSKDLNGIQLADWLVHGRDHGSACSWPPRLALEVTEQFGLPTSLCEMTELGKADYKAFLDLQLSSVEMKAELSGQYLDQGGWDLFMTVFKESHCIGHLFWHLLDPAHPQHDARLALSLGNPIKKVYTAIDAAICRLLERVGPETTVIIFSDLGMGPNYTGTALMEDVLLRLGNHKPTSDRASTSLLKSIREKIPANIREQVKSRLGHASRVWRDLEYRNRKCFTVGHNEISGAIRINLVGRERYGRIHRGTEYDAYCEYLISNFLELINLDTGEPLVQEVLRTAYLYPGDYLDNLPDLLVVWNRNAPISCAGSVKVGEIRSTYPGYWSGNHVPDGIFFASGPGIEPEELTPPVSVMDMAPTIAALLEIRLPDVDGVPIAAICGKERR